MISPQSNQDDLEVDIFTSLVFPASSLLTWAAARGGNGAVRGSQGDS